jgi:predicted RNA-binding Zn ribbon-like protein
VRFGHDTIAALEAGVAIANSAFPPDSMTTLAELDALFERFGYTGRHDRTAAELDAVRDLRPRLVALFTADRETAAALANEVLAEAGALPQLVRHDSFDWHLHAVPGDAPLATRVAVESAMAMTDVVRADEMSRFGRCADEHCDGIVLDLSRNRSRRYCSTACTNRNATAAYRARAAQPPG